MPLPSTDGASPRSASVDLSPGAVVLVNPFVVPDGRLEETVTYWERARAFLAEQPGYVSTRLHQSLRPDATYRLVNVAVWESPEAFQSAMRAMQAEVGPPTIAALETDPALYTVIRE